MQLSVFPIPLSAELRLWELEKNDRDYGGDYGSLWAESPCLEAMVGVHIIYGSIELGLCFIFRIFA